MQGDRQSLGVEILSEIFAHQTARNLAQKEVFSLWNCCSATSKANTCILLKKKNKKWGFRHCWHYEPLGMLQNVTFPVTPRPLYMGHTHPCIPPAILHWFPWPFPMSSCPPRAHPLSTSPSPVPFLAAHLSSGLSLPSHCTFTSKHSQFLQPWVRNKGHDNLVHYILHQYNFWCFHSSCLRHYSLRY